MAKYDNYSEYANLIVGRFGEQVFPEENGPAISYEAEADYFFILNAPDQYEVEEEMLEYAKTHPDATVKELIKYFNEITPDGDPPCASEWEDDEDEDEQ